MAPERIRWAREDEVAVLEVPRDQVRAPGIEAPTRFGPAIRVHRDLARPP